jgi:hypothetical protein
VMVMRCAAARPVSHSERDTQLFEIADSVLQAAQTESALWAARRLEDAAPSQKV